MFEFEDGFEIESEKLVFKAVEGIPRSF